MNCSSCPITISPDYTGNQLHTLNTPQPYYLPGYGGYVPQEKFRPGHTYGTTSHRILLDPCIHMSPRSVLTNAHPEFCVDEYGRPGLGANELTQAKMALVESRVNSIGRQQYLPNMVSGYAGFIPRNQTILGHTYSPACNRALANFEQEQWRDRLFNKELEALDGWRFCYRNKPWESPEVINYGGGDLQEFARCGDCNCVEFPKIQLPIESKAGCPCGDGDSCKKVYDCDPGQSEMSLLTPNHSLYDYGERRTWGIANLVKKPCGVIKKWINPHKFSRPIYHPPEIYKDCEGLKPHYLGHAPGYNFKFGKTYGDATRNSKKALGKPLKGPICYPHRTENF